MQTDYSDRISYLIVDTSQHEMAQHALNVSQQLFPLAKPGNMSKLNLCR